VHHWLKAVIDSFVIPTTKEAYGISVPEAHIGDLSREDCNVIRLAVMTIFLQNAEVQRLHWDPYFIFCSKKTGILVAE